MLTRAPGSPVRAPERRFAPRAPSKLPVRLGAGGVVSDARSVDISMGGVLLSDIESMLIAAARSYVDVVIQLPDDPKPIRAMALTVWWQGPFQAFRFVKMSEQDRLRLAEHIDRTASQHASH